MPRERRERTQVLLRVDPAIADALRRWADDEMRSTNAQIELALRDALRRAGRLPPSNREDPPHPP